MLSPQGKPLHEALLEGDRMGTGTGPWRSRAPQRFPLPISGHAQKSLPGHSGEEAAPFTRST